MAPVVSLAFRRLPPTLTAIELRSYASSRYPEPDCVFHVWPLVRESEIASAGSTQCATVAVKVKLAKFQQLQTAIDGMCRYFSERPLHHDGVPWRISVDKDFYSIVPLFEHPRGADIDIFTIHGLGGHAFHTWCNDAKGSPQSVTNWTRDLLPGDLDSAKVKARISSIGYNARFLHKADRTANIRTLAESLLDELASRQSTQWRPFFFICHSLGGLILCQALILCLYDDVSYGIEKPQYRDVFVRDGELLLKGIQFLGTPFDGSLVADTVRPLVDAFTSINPWPTNPGLVAALTNGNPDLSEIVNKFRYIHTERGISLWIGCEAQPMLGRLVTTRSSAEARFGQSAKVATLNADHCAMVRYSSPDPNYIKIAKGMVKMIEERMNRGSAAVPSANNNTRLTASHRAGTMPLPSRSNGHSQSMPASLHALADMSLAENARESHSQSSAPDVEQRSFDAHGISAAPDSTRALVAAAASQIVDGSKLAKLQQCDTVFVIDDTSSMTLPVNAAESEASIARGERYKDRWNVLEQCLEAIVDFATKADEDGIDVRFLKCGADIYEGGHPFNQDHLNNSQHLLDRLVSIRSLLGTQRCEGGTFFFEVLFPLLSERTLAWEKWGENLKAGHMTKPPKFLNVIVVTDGAANDALQTEWTISHVAERLDACKAPPRVVGVQFVQIGDDAAAGAWLRNLDDELGRKRKPEDKTFRDMVDTKPWDPNNIVKILLGAMMPGEDDS